MQTRFADFLQRNAQSEQAKAIVEMEKKEMAIYEKYNNYYSYGFYVARKLWACRRKKQVRLNVDISAHSKPLLHQHIP